ncbi:hypothetical protein C4D60_Mb00t01860 [Musa balbisiana]|uniref:DNA-directed RNA polymerase n=2 Tax=Musa balbisiana TaxID=52838 RepID=A0A4V4H254_MUSBA|nr:hypothetical protein C4D60_Mb00t01860 [Musa balbisiana]
MIRVYISQKREIKVGDKVAGRHGNKGIISKILPRQDMPYLQDGTPVDMVFNPLGVPSRMNVGQIFECSLGLAGDLLKRHYRIAPFDERYEQEASRKLVFSELYEASKQTKNPWVFEPEYPGKSRIFDGRTGNPFEQPVLIGKSYILKLIHQVDDKIHGRSSGHYALVTQQPLRGRAKQGGQRVGEMEVWALEGFGVAHILQEMLTYKSDHIRARQEVLGATIIGGRVSNPEDAPESFRLLVRELRSLALELNHFLTHVTSQGPERITKEIPHLEAHLLRNLDRNGVVMLGSWVETGDILVGKLTPQTANESSYAPEDRLLRAILGIQVSTAKETSLKLPIGGRGRVIDVRWIRKKGGSCYNSEMIRVYISQKREIKVGDKVAGRHGNKGIISKILPRQDMPYLQDGTPVDMVFNPLGVPSRMNVGQIFECSLGLAGDLLKRHYRIAPFDERYEQEASRKLVFSELYEASKQTKNPWVFEPEYPGKSRIFDGRTGNPFEQPVLIGKSYILKLIHQVDDKIHGRSSGHYALVTQQPLRGRAKQGGQRVGEMEVWALEGFGVAHILQEMLTYKSDHIRARQEVLVIGAEKEDPKFCEQCGVEFVDSRIRRYQMGYIKLACPVTHVWYLKRLPSYIANLLDKPLKELEGLVYCDV